MSELSESAVNVEEGIELEKGEKLQENEKSEGKKGNNREFHPSILRTNHSGGWNQSNYRGKSKVNNQAGRVMTNYDPRDFYMCGKTGYFARDCSTIVQTKVPNLSFVTCYTCGQS